MKRLTTIGILGAFLCGISVAGVGGAQSSTTVQQPTSIADYARQLKAQQDQATKVGTKPVKVFTNDDLPAARAEGGVTVTPDTTSSEGGNSGTSSTGGHGAKYYQKAYAKLLARKEMDQRELDVLQKHQAQSNIQYYTDPNKALQQDYSRSDIADVEKKVNAKKLALEQDDQAISDLQDQLRRDGGEPGWLQAGPTSIEPDIPKETKSEKSSGKKDKKSKEYWQTKFRAARANLAQAEEAQKLVQDEIDLLKMRQVQEPSAEAQTEINGKLAARQTEMETAATTTDKAKRALDDLKKEFDESGAPPEWSETE
ncbi:MAG: hypothetical protein ACYDA9_10095 [Terriglobia bacterium]